MRPGDRVITPDGPGTIATPTEAELRVAQLAGLPADRQVLVVDLADGWRWFDRLVLVRPTTTEES